MQATKKRGDRSPLPFSLEKHQLPCVPRASGEVSHEQVSRVLSVICLACLVKPAPALRQTGLTVARLATTDQT
jgi:hypothetical protein